MAESHRGVQSIASVPSSVEGLLRQTMVLGLPTKDIEKPTFYFDRDVAWVDHDAEEKPWDWTATPSVDITKAPVKAICAFEFFAPLGRTGATFSEVGDFYQTTVIVTVMGTDFREVDGCSYMTVGPKLTKWYFRYWKPAIALGGINVYEIHFQAEDTA